MKRSDLACLGAAAAAFVISCGQAASYDDCVFKHVTDATDQAAVVAVRQLCLREFERNLTSAELSQVTGRAEQASLRGEFVGMLYNGSSHLTVTEIHITLDADGQPTATAYRTPVWLPPQGTGEVRIDILETGGQKYTWSITGGKCVEQ